MRWLGLHFPAFGLELFAAEPGTDPGAEPGTDSGIATVLLEDNRVVLRNRAAKAAGILPGATLATAHTICTDLVHFHRSPQRERERLVMLAESLYQLSSQVSLHEPDALVLEIDGSRRLHGDEAALCERAQAIVHTFGHSACIQGAQTPAAALVRARAAGASLHDAPLHAMCLEPSVIERLQDMGIDHIGALLQLPPKQLAARFGKGLVQALQRLTGARSDPQVAITPAAEFEETLHLLEPIRSKSGLLFPMQRLAGRLQHWLTGRQLAVQHIDWTFGARVSGGETAAMSVKFAQPQQHKRNLLGITRLQLERQELPADVLDVGLRAAHLVPWQEHYDDLFQALAPGAQGTARSPGELVDQLHARLGDGVCRCLDLMDQHPPEWRWSQRRPATVPGTGSAGIGNRTRAGAGAGAGVGAKKKVETGGNAESPSNPLWLLAAPKPLQPGELTLLSGPQRIRSGWWQQSVFRDYYVARNRRGGHCWVFLDANQQWYLHGYFA